MAETVIFQDTQAMVTDQRIQWGGGASALALSAVSGASVLTIPSMKHTHTIRASIGAALLVLFGACSTDRTVAGNPSSLASIAGLAGIVTLILTLNSAWLAYRARPQYQVVAATNQGPTRLGSYSDPQQAQALMGAVMQTLAQRA